MKNFMFIFLLSLSLNLQSQCFKDIATGYRHSLAITNSGTLYSWGDDSNGEGYLGYIVRFAIVYTPLQVGSDNNWKAVFAGRNSSFGIKTDGTLWAWGNNSNGNLGIGSREGAKELTQVGSDTDWKFLSTNEATLAIKTDGTLWGWGYNLSGQLGINKKSFELYPTQVNTDTDWVKVVSCGTHTLAIKDDGSLWACGDNQEGSLGNGNMSSTDQLNFERVGNENNWLDVSGGYGHSLALKTDGTIWGWGRNNVPWIGTKIFGEQYPSQILTPTKLSLNNDWDKISGKRLLIGRKKDGSIWNIKEGVQIGENNNWHNIKTSSEFFLALKEDNTLWSYGKNYNGQLGVGNNVNETIIPLEIKCSTLSIESLNENKLFTIFPNPTSDIIFFRNKNNNIIKKIRLYDINGRVVLKIKENATELNINPIKAGSYTLFIESSEGNESFKIIKK
ncbi:T9SS type A sorting domain-containing protein [Polaribacter sp. M15]